MADLIKSTSIAAIFRKNIKNLSGKFLDNDP